MAALAATARKVAPTNVPVLITGETGTGKEILARAIHAASTRASATFLPFNCSAGPRDMIDAQLFGHRRGAFTGALEHAPGIVRAATRRASTSASLPPPTSISTPRCRAAASARTSSTASTSSACTCRRCASAASKSRSSRSTTCASTPRS
jgi:hypothetical protein